MRKVVKGEKIEDIIFNQGFALRCLRNPENSSRLTIIGKDIEIDLDEKAIVQTDEDTLEISEETDYMFLKGKVAEFYAPSSYKQFDEAEKVLADFINNVNEKDIVTLIGYGTTGNFFLEMVIKYVKRPVRLATVNVSIPFYRSAYIRASAQETLLEYCLELKNEIENEKEKSLLIEDYMKLCLVQLKDPKGSKVDLKDWQRKMYNKYILKGLDYKKLENHIWVNFVLNSEEEQIIEEETFFKKILLTLLNCKIKKIPFIERKRISDLCSEQYIYSSPDIAWEKALTYFKFNN